MHQVERFIFLFLVGTSVLNLIIAAVARLKTGIREFNNLILYWFSIFINFVAISFLSTSPTQIAFAFFFTAPPMMLMGKMLRNSRNIKTNWHLILAIQAAGMLVTTFLLLRTDLGFSTSLMPFIFTMSYHWIYPIYETLIKNRNEANWIEKAMAIIFITGIVSCFSYAFYRLDEDAAWWGWGQAIIHYQCLSVFLPLLINHHRQTTERKNLELAIERLSGRNTPFPSTETSELYRLLELQISQKEDYSRRLSETNRHLEEERLMNEILIKTISHDLANPLTVVSAYLEMIMTGRIAREDNEKIQERMRQNLQSAMEMITRIRKAIVTRSQAELVKLGQVDVKLALQRTEMLYEQRLRDKKIRLNLRLPPEEAIVLADENALVEHVFSNILSNAVKFSFENSEINIDVRGKAESIEVEFRDFGVGIGPPQTEKRIRSTPGTCGEEGTGFGMIVMGYFLRKFDSELTIVPHSENGEKGTSFIITLKKPSKNEKFLR